VNSQCCSSVKTQHRPFRAKNEKKSFAGRMAPRMHARGVKWSVNLCRMGLELTTGRAVSPGLPQYWPLKSPGWRMALGFHPPHTMPSECRKSLLEVMTEKGIERDEGCLTRSGAGLCRDTIPCVDCSVVTAVQRHSMQRASA
jgi:hypothetical protein